MVLTYVVFGWMTGWSCMRGDWSGASLAWFWAITFSPLKPFGLVEGAGRVNGLVKRLIRWFGRWAGERAMAGGGFRYG